LFEEISRDLNITQAQNADFLYAVYLDDPMVVAAQRQRFGTGVLVDGSRKSIKTKALKLNEAIAKIPPAERSEEVSTHHKWEFSNLPSVDAAIVQFPSTYGFVSALITSYRVSYQMFCQECSPISSLLSLMYLIDLGRPNTDYSYPTEIRSGKW
jgi:hypothetical protein